MKKKRSSFITKAFSKCTISKRPGTHLFSAYNTISYSSLMFSPMYLSLINPFWSSWIILGNITLSRFAIQPKAFYGLYGVVKLVSNFPRGVLGLPTFGIHDCNDPLSLRYWHLLTSKSIADSTKQETSNVSEEKFVKF